MTEESKKKLSESHKGQKAWNKGIPTSEETKKKISNSEKGRKAWNKGVSCPEEIRKKISESLKGKPFSEERKRNISESIKGEKNGNWNGGNSFEPYCYLFNKEFKEKVRDKFNRKCFICGKSEEENGKKLSVHHINYNKNCLCDDSNCLFVPLCNSCHSKTNKSREYWEKLLTAAYIDSKILNFDDPIINISDILNEMKSMISEIEEERIKNKGII